MALQLYHYDFWPNSMAAKIALLYRKAQFEILTVDMSVGAHDTPAFRKLSPSGEPPVLVDTEGPSGQHPLTMFEVLAVMAHLDANAARLKLEGTDFVPESPCGIPLTLQWVAWTRAHVSPAVQGLLLHGKVNPAPSRSSAKFGAAKAQFQESVSVLETRVPPPGSYLNRDELHPPAGSDKGTFSAADLVLAANLTYGRLLPQTEKIIEKSPNVNAYLKSIEDLPVFAQALKGVTKPDDQGNTPGEIKPP